MYSRKDSLKSLKSPGSPKFQPHSPRSRSPSNETCNGHQDESSLSFGKFEPLKSSNSENSYHGEIQAQRNGEKSQFQQQSNQSNYPVEVLANGKSETNEDEEKDDKDLDELCSEGSMKSFSNYQRMIDIISSSAITPVIIISETGSIKSVNEQVSHLTKYQRWNLISRNIKILMREQDAENHDGYLRRYRISKQRRILGEARDGLWLLTCDKQIVPISLKASNLTTDSGTVFIGVLKDLSSNTDLEWMQNIVYNVFPSNVVNCLRHKRDARLKFYGSFATIQIFSEELDLDRCFSNMDRIIHHLDKIAQKWKIEKVKGDFNAYSVVCGVIDNEESHAIRVVKFLIESAVFLQSIQVHFRASVATGQFLSGILGCSWRCQWTLVGPCRKESEDLLHQGKYSQILINQATYVRTSYFLPFAKPVSDTVYVVDCTELPFQGEVNWEYEYN